MVSQMDVAKRAGVSFMTVSRVINNKNNVKEATRKKVLKAIKELGYYPNVLGRGLNINKTETIGILIPLCSHLFSTQYYTELLRGVEQYCAESGFGILFYPRREESGDIDYQRLFQERRVDGLLIIAPPLKDLQLLTLIKKKIPFVVIDGRGSGGKNKRVVYIDADNIGGASKAVEYLIKRGHKKIAHISGWLYVVNGKDRLYAYKNTLKKYKIPVKNEYIVKGDFTEISGYNAMKNLLKLKDRPTAVFAANDLMAIGAIKAIKEIGLSVPEEISIVGFDDIPLASYTIPPLTTVRQPAFQMGYEAAKNLIEMIKSQRTETKSKIMKTALIVRNSTN